MNRKKVMLSITAVISIALLAAGAFKVYGHFSWERDFLQSMSTSMGKLQEENEQKDQRLEELEEEISRLQQALDPPVRIVCWGDSLTAGAGGDGVTYPNVIQKLALDQGIQVDVANMGVGGESSKMILARGGGAGYCVGGMSDSGRDRACGSSSLFTGWQRYKSS